MRPDVNAATKNTNIKRGATIWLAIMMYGWSYYVVCVVTLICTRVHACMRNGARPRLSQNLHQNVLQKLHPPFRRCSDGFGFAGCAKRGATRQREILGHLLWKVSVKTYRSACDWAVGDLSVQWWRVILSLEILGHLLRNRE